MGGGPSAAPVLGLGLRDKDRSRGRPNVLRSDVRSNSVSPRRFHRKKQVRLRGMGPFRVGRRYRVPGFAYGLDARLLPRGRMSGCQGAGLGGLDRSRFLPVLAACIYARAARSSFGSLGQGRKPNQIQNPAHINF